MGTPDPTDAVAELIESIRRERRYGVVTCAVEEGMAPGSSMTQALDAIDALVARHGLKGIGQDWVEVPYADAVAHLTAVLHRDMAYYSEIMPRGRAGELAERFLGLFAGGRFFTNSEDGPRQQPPPSLPWSWGSSPLTDATFDTGVVAVAAGRTGQLWVEDED